MKGHLLNFWIRVVSCVLETSNPKRAKWGLQRVNPTANQIPSWGEKLTIYKQQTNWPGAQPFAGDCVWPQAGRMRSAGTGKQLQSYWNHRCVRGGHKEPSSQNPEKEQRILAGIRRPSHGWDSAPVNSSSTYTTQRLDAWFPFGVWGFNWGEERVFESGEVYRMPLLYHHLIHSSSLLGSSSLGSDLPSGKWK